MVYPISHVLKELYADMAREDLASVVMHGLPEVINSGGEAELVVLMKFGALSRTDIEKAHNRFLDYNRRWF
jgi:hypothetical protein